MMWKLIFSVCFLSIFVWHMYLQPWSLVAPIYIGDMSLRLDTMQMTLVAQRSRRMLLHVDIFKDVPSLSTENIIQSCPREIYKIKGQSHCVEFKNVARLEIDYKKHTKGKCYRIKWTSFSPNFAPKDCFSLDGAHWYGGSSGMGNLWPINEYKSSMLAYSIDSYGSIIEKYWISSKGIAIHVDDDIPIQMSWNHNGNNKACIKSYNKDPELIYTICQNFDIVSAHRLLFNRVYETPKSQPIAINRTIERPLWYINSNDNLTQFAKDVGKNGFPAGIIDLGKITIPGDFNTANVKQTINMTSYLHKMLFEIRAKMSLFMSINSSSFNELLNSNGLLLTADKHHNLPYLISREDTNEIGAILSVLESKASIWFKNKLLSFQKDLSIDTFRFPGIENIYHIKWLQNELSDPLNILSEYADLLNELDGSVAMETAHRTQKYPMFTCLTPIENSWRGLRTIIPQMLTTNLLGYYFTLPSPIGGISGQSYSVSKELYIRWIELMAYLPAMQISIPPWHYDAETVKLARAYVKTHQQQVAPVYSYLFEQAIKSGIPPIRPLWWHNPHDKDSLEISSEFLIGGGFLVAPILEEGERKRDIYLPRGEWKDNLRGGVLKGRQWIKDYRVELQEIATFKYETKKKNDF